MSSPSQNNIAVPNKKDSSVAIVIGQPRRFSETKGEDIKNNSKLDIVGQHKKKFLINDILQQKTLQEQALPASHKRFQLMSLFASGRINYLLK